MASVMYGVIVGGSILIMGVLYWLIDPDLRRKR